MGHQDDPAVARKLREPGAQKSSPTAVQRGLGLVEDHQTGRPTERAGEQVRSVY